MNITWKGNLTEHFTLAEYTVGNPITADIVITKGAMLQANMLEEFRQMVGYPVYVTSWYRTTAYNNKVGGIPTSNHTKGMATDIHFSFTLTERIAIIMMKIWKYITNKHGVVGEAGLYSWGLHLGIQSDAQVKANGGKFFNWDSRKGKQINMAFIV